MSKQTSTQTIDVYLPANLSMTGDPGPIERFVTKPIRQQSELWVRNE